jgi:thiol-disulfide isomerase/thioredoxin
MTTACRIHLTTFAACLLMLVLPAWAQQPAAVQSVSIQHFDNVVRQPGHCLVAVMAAWCHPCIAELPVLDALAQKYGVRGLRVVGLSLDYAGPDAMRPIIERLKIRFPIYWAGEAAIEHYEITKIPLLIMLRDGHRVKRLEGGRNRATLEAEIVTFLGRN